MKKTVAILLVLAMLFALAACASENEDGAPAGTKLASDPEVVDYYLYVPEEWTVTSSTGTTIAQSVSNVIVTHHTSLRINASNDARHTILNYFYGNDFLPHFFEGKNTFGEVALDELSYKSDYLDYALNYSHTLTDETTYSEDKGYFTRMVKLYDKALDTETNEEVTTFSFVTTPAFTTLKKGDKEVAALKFVYTAYLDGSAVQQMTYLAYVDACFYNITFTCSPSLFDDDAAIFEGIIENFSFKD